MNRRNLLLLLFYALPVLLLCACNSSPSITYKITGVRLFNAIDSGGYYPVEYTGDIPAKNYAIGMATSAMLTGETSFAHDPDSHFRSGNNVTGLNVYSLTNFNAGHPALASLNDCFLYLGYNNPYRVGYEADSLDYVIKHGYVFTNFYFDRTTLVGGTYDYLTLMQPPDSLGTRTFVIDVVFVDGTRFTDTTTVNLQ